MLKLAEEQDKSKTSEGDEGVAANLLSTVFRLPAQYDLIIVCRTEIDLALIPQIDKLLAPGGIILYHHFVEGAWRPTSLSTLRRAVVN